MARPFGELRVSGCGPRPGQLGDQCTRLFLRDPARLFAFCQPVGCRSLTADTPITPARAGAPIPGRGC